MTAVAGIAVPLGTALNGVAAGIMLSTVIGIVPMMLTQPYRGYVQTVQFLWPRYDPLMPILNGTAFVLAAGSALAVGDVAARPALAVAAVLLGTVITISVTRNVPVNRYVSGLDPGREPVDWARRDPRGRWSAWNLVRTTLALAAFGSNVLALTLAS